VCDGLPAQISPPIHIHGTYKTKVKMLQTWEFSVFQATTAAMHGAPDCSKIEELLVL
jgi:hypothetical protein